MSEDRVLNFEKNESPTPPKAAPKGKAFWLSFAAAMVAIFLSALDLVGGFHCLVLNSEALFLEL